MLLPPWPFVTHCSPSPVDIPHTSFCTRTFRFIVSSVVCVRAAPAYLCVPVKLENSKKVRTRPAVVFPSPCHAVSVSTNPNFYYTPPNEFTAGGISAYTWNAYAANKTDDVNNIEFNIKPKYRIFNTLKTINNYYDCQTRVLYTLLRYYVFIYYVSYTRNGGTKCGLLVTFAPISIKIFGPVDVQNVLIRPRYHV